MLHFFDAGTSNTRTVYADRGLSTALGVTVTCDSGGFPTSDGNAKVEIYTGTGAYKVTLKDSSGTTIWTLDNIIGALDTSPFTAAAFAAPDTDCASDTSDTTLTTGMLGTVRNGNPTGGSFTYTLPSAITATNGKGYVIRHVGTANQINIAGVLGQTIDGLTTYVLKGQYESVELVSDGANWHIKTDANRGPFSNLLPQGYLTLTSATPIITGDVAAATSVYYTPFTGNLVPIYDGTRWRMYEFDELTLSLASQHALSTLYDVFVFLNSGTVTIGTGPAWTTSTAGSGARGTGSGTTQLTRTKGLYLNTVAMTARNGSSTYSVAAARATYLGSIWIDGTAGQVTCHASYGQSRKWGVWNAFNRQPILLKAGDSTSSWTYNSSTVRAANGASTNSLTVLSGLAEPVYDFRLTQTCRSGGGQARAGLGYNSTTAFSGNRCLVDNLPATGDVSLTASYALRATIGVNTITMLESGNASTATFTGTETAHLMTAAWMG